MYPTAAEVAAHRLEGTEKGIHGFGSKNTSAGWSRGVANEMLIGPFLSFPMQNENESTVEKPVSGGVVNPR